MWTNGSILIEGITYHYWIKHYEERSQYGIYGGKISKLMMKSNDEIVCNYDRSWDIEPVDMETEIALEILLKKYN